MKKRDAATNRARYAAGIAEQPPSKTNLEITNVLQNQVCHLCHCSIAHLEKVRFDRCIGMKHVNCN